MKNLKLRGVDHIQKVTMRGGSKRTLWDPNVGFIVKDEWVLETEGSNLLAVLGVDYVDASRTVSNDIVEVFSVLGIEGVRAAILNELRKVITFDGSYVNYRHLACLVDVMTIQGHLMAIDRHGINRGDSGPLLRSSFEETVDMLMDAAAFAEEEVLKGVTENILLGQLAKVGTGEIDLLLDEDKVMRAVEVVHQWNEGHDEDDGMISAETPYAMSTPFGMSPSAANSGEMSPFISGMAGGFSPTIGSFSPSYAPTSGNYGSKSPLYSSSPKHSSPMYSPSSPNYSPTRYVTIAFHVSSRYIILFDNVLFVVCPHTVRSIAQQVLRILRLVPITHLHRKCFISSALFGLCYCYRYLIYFLFLSHLPSSQTGLLAH